MPVQEKQGGPIPRGVRRCQRYRSEFSGKCGQPCDGPESSVVALCNECAAVCTPRGTQDDQRRIYQNLLDLYGWKAEGR